MDLSAALAVSFLRYYDHRVPEHMRDEDPVHVQARLTMVADEIVRACRADPLPTSLGWTLPACVALVATTAKWESGLLRSTHSGARLGPSGERCLMQLHRGVTDNTTGLYVITPWEWEHSPGEDRESTELCVRLGLRTILHHLTRCSIRYEPGGWSRVAFFFAEYHRPTPYCSSILSGMNTDRALSYAGLLRRLSRAASSPP